MTPKCGKPCRSSSLCLCMIGVSRICEAGLAVSEAQAVVVLVYAQVLVMFDITVSELSQTGFPPCRIPRRRKLAGPAYFAQNSS